MNIQFLRFTFILLIFLSIASTSTAQTVTIPDSNLRAAIAAELGKTLGDTITTSDMAALTYLGARNSNIIDLTGLEHAINLTSLSLSSNSISDITSLLGLTSLTSLSLSSNSISDITSLSGLTNLTRLSLWDNSISDISSLSGLTNLIGLWLWNNSISDITSLSGLTSLTWLSLSSNSISDITSLSGLTNLTRLYLPSNSISDISSLSGLTNLTRLYLPSNSISDISSLSGLTNLTELYLNRNSISDLSALVTNTGLGSGDTVNVRVNPLSSVSIGTYIPVLLNRGVSVRFDDIGAGVVDLPDSNLRAAIATELGKAWSAPITTSDMAALTYLDARNSNIIDLAGLEHAINLALLNLGENLISDISSLASLTNLTVLDLGGNSTSDITSLASLTNLTVLDLRHNSISDISSLSGLTNLTSLYLSSNSISDISSLSGLTNLTSLYLSSNSISDISSLASLTNLTVLYLDSNSISDLSSLAGLTNLTWLYLSSNSVSDISSLSGLTNLTWLDLPSNSISDISSLSGLTNLTWLFLRNNSISDLSALVTNTGLESDDEVNVEGNPLSSISIDMHIPALQSRGVSVRFDDIIAGVVVDLPDVNLRAVIEEVLGKASDDPITTSDMATFIQLNASNSNISDLTGLEHAINLRLLSLDDNSISDLSSLSGLTNLRLLSLDGNSISDLSSLSGLTNLRFLTGLSLDGNFISDLSSLSGLTNLRSLSLGSNSISDISSLSGLTNLRSLYLKRNSISDLSALVTNTRLGSGDVVNVEGNPLSSVSIDTHIPTLQSRDVRVEFDNQTHPALLKISGDNQKGAAFAPLSQPLVVEAQDANGSVLAGVSVTFTVVAGGGTLSVTNTTTDANGRAQNILTLGPNLGTNTVEVSAAGIQGTAIFHAISDAEAPPIIADVDGDGSVNILDLVAVVSEFGSEKPNLAADVNRDGVINILDLILVAGMFEGAAAAPAAHPQAPEALTAAEVQGWLTDARALEVTDPIMKQGFMVLEQLLVSLTPRETELLPNYPNPFNPETWIPYRLAEDSFVTLTIYDQVGHVVRTLEVGHQIASAYENCSKAVYWDGRNEFGEGVASGVYFYHLSAGDYSATRKMVILK